METLIGVAVRIDWQKLPEVMSGWTLCSSIPQWGGYIQEITAKDPAMSFISHVKSMTLRQPSAIAGDIVVQQVLVAINQVVKPLPFRDGRNLRIGLSWSQRVER